MLIKEFIQNNTRLCIGMAGLAFIGYLGYKAIRWIINKCQQTEKIDQIAKNHLSQTPSNNQNEPKNFTPTISPDLKDPKGNIQNPFQPSKIEIRKEKEAVIKEEAKPLKDVDSLKLKIPQGSVTIGQGEYVVFHNSNTGKKEINKEVFEKVYANFNQFAPGAMINGGATQEECANRYELIKKEIKKIDNTLEIAFIPRTLYELLYIRESIEEDVENNKICENQDFDKREAYIDGKFGKNKENYESSLMKENEANPAKHKCWHLCHFTDEGDNNHPGVKDIAFRLNQVMIDTLKPKIEGFSYKELSEYTENQIDYLIEHANKGKKESEEIKKGSLKQKFLTSEKIKGPTVCFANGEDWWSTISAMGIRDKNIHEAQILRNAVALDCSEIAKKAFLLYRGSNFQIDSVCDLKNKDVAYSLSYGTSLFTGAIYDSTANPYIYMKGTNQQSTMTLNGYALPIPFEKLNTSPFYIPITNTLSQLLGRGESFHGRTKAWKDFDLTKIKGIFGFNVGGDKRDHLKSDLTKEEFLKQFNEYKNQAIQVK